MARLISGQTLLYSYRVNSEQSVNPPNLKAVTWDAAHANVVRLTFDQPVVWMPELSSEFLIDGVRGKVTGGTAAGNALELTLTAGAANGRPHTITYLDSEKWSQSRLLKGKNGIAALTFCEVPVAVALPSRSPRRNSASP